MPDQHILLIQQDILHGVYLLAGSFKTVHEVDSLASF
jgi:hypothetical protein